MAGESPDKSEQRKSSGETAESERDPRLAVFREPASRPTPDERVDQPTAIFKMPPTPEEPESSPGGDARLRAAVAAWVATADEPDEPEERAVGAEAAGAADTGAGAGVDADVDAKPEAAEAAGAGAEGGSASGAGAGGDEPLGVAADDEPERESAGDEGPEGDTAEAVGATEDGSASSGPVAGESADGDEPQAADAADEPDNESADADPAPDAESEGEGERERDEQAVAGGDEPVRTGSGSEPARVGSDAAPEVDSEADSDSEPDGDSDGGTAKAGADEAAGDAVVATSAPVAGGAKSARAATESAIESDSSPAADAAAPKAGADSGTGSAAAPEPRQDQHTAVFRAVRPGKPVDQPTTTLKNVRPSAPVEPPESAVERTSTFVPLKPDDVRQAPPRRPEQKPEGTPAAPPAPPARPASAPAAPRRPAPAAAASAAPQAIPEAEQTRLQPLPPRPPLDMLAELTNKPAPPETPTRTAVRRVKIWTPLLLLAVVIFAVVQFLRPLPAPALALTADPSYTFKGGAPDMPWPSTGQSAVEVQGVGSIGTNGAQKSAPIASVAKVMTAYVILKEHPVKGKEVGPKITVDALAEEQSKAADESVAAIKEGQQFTEKQMLQLLMIPSGNNIARLLARWDAKSEDAFVKKMNDAAKDLGMKNSTYTDPSGFEKTTVSTATDQLKLAKAVMEYDVFRGIVDLPEVEIPGIDGKIYNNNNILLNPGVSGIKTGSTTPAGGNLVWAADTIIDGEKRRIVGAVMGQQTDGTLDAKLQLALTNSLKLIQAAQRDVTSATVVKKGDVVGYIDDGLGGRTPVVATKDLKAVGWPGLKVELAISDGGKTPPHTAKAGTEVGQVTVGTGPGQVKAPVALQKDLAEPAFGDKLTRIG